MKFRMFLSFMLFLSASIFAQGTVTVTGTDLSPAFSHGTSTPIIRLSFSGITLSPIINYIKVDRTGTATNTDVPTAQLWRDLDKNDIVDGSDVQLDQTRYFQGTTTQSAQFSVLNYSPPASENLLIIYDVSADANASHTAGADMPTDGGYITGGNETVVTFLGITTANQPLPVELTSLIAFVQNKIVILNWQTATEINNYGFDVQRLNPPLSSLPGVEKKGWVKIGFVEGHGNSNSPKEYSFEDKNPHEGSSRYRLKQIDLDGTYEYSQIVEVNFGGYVNFILDQNYPNPFNPSTTIEYSIPTVETTRRVVFTNVKSI
ncbi:MAG: hypothetical protein AB1521_11740 [Bacteroidota bacterium]